MTSSVPMDVAFVELRRGLQKAHYSQPLGIESFALVSKLFDDVQVLQKSVDQHQRDEEAAVLEMQNAQQKLVPLRRENCRLVESNNTLHKQLLEQAEKMDAVERKSRTQVEAANADAANYKYLFNTQSFRLKSQETEISRLKDRVHSLLERSNAFNSQPVENAPGSWNGPRQHIDIAPQFDVSSERESVGTLHSMNRSEVSEARSRDEVELVEIANRKILALSSQLEEAEATAIKLNEELAAVRKQSASKDAEMARLSHEASLTRRTEHEGDAVFQQQSSEQTIVQLNEQVEFLTAEMMNLETEVGRYKGIDSMVEKLRSQRDKAVKELDVSNETIKTLQEKCQQNIDRVHTLEAEKKADLERSRMRVPRAIQELEVSVKKNKELEQKLARLSAEKTNSKHEVEQITELYESYQHDKDTMAALLAKAEAAAASAKQQLEDLQKQHQESTAKNISLQQQLDQTSNEAKQLASEMQLHQDSITALNKLVASLNQRELDSQTKLEEAQTHFDTLAGDNRQLKQQLAETLKENSALRDRVSSAVNESVASTRSSTAVRESSERLQSTLENVSRQRDEYRNEMRQLNDMLAQQKQEHAELIGETQRLQTQLKQTTANLLHIEQERNQLLEQRAQDEHRITKLSSELTQLSAEHAQIQASIEPLRAVEGEADEHRELNAQLYVRLKQLERDVESRSRYNDELNNELKHKQQHYDRAVQQREALTQMIRQFDSELVHIQAQVRAITEEREHYKFLHEQAQSELNVRALNESTSASTSATLDAMIRELQSSKASVELACQQAKANEQSALQAVERSKRNQQRIEQERDEALANIEQQIKKTLQATSQREEARAQLSTAEQEKAALRNQLELAQRRMVNAEELSKSLREQQRQQNTLHAQIEHAKDNANMQLDSLRAQIQSLEQNLKSREAELADAHQRIGASAEVISNHELALQRLDAQRDRVQALLDEKCEVLDKLNRDLQAAKQDKADAVQTQRHLQEQIQRMQVSLASHERHNAAADASNDELSATLKSLESQLQLKCGEVDALSSDLSNMAKENQFLNGELSVAVQERDALVRERDAVAAKLVYSQESVKVAQREHEDVLANYRLLADENGRLQASVSSLDAKSTSQLHELRRAQATCANLEARNQEFQRTNEALMSEVQTFERTNETLTRSLSGLQSRLDETEDARSQLIGDLSSTRSLSVGLEKDREALKRSAAQHQSTIDRLSRECDDLKKCVDAANVQHRAQHNRIVELESLLAKYRVENLNQVRPYENVGASELIDTAEPKDSVIEKLQNELVEMRQHIVRYEKELSEKEKEVASSHTKPAVLDTQQLKDEDNANPFDLNQSFTP